MRRKPTNLTDALRAAIEADGRSLSELGGASGVSKSQISRFMRGERTLTIETADALLSALGLTVELTPAARVKKGGRR
ncbi:MAG: helix-turn-helix transcriptional regulator [Phycisphaerales bacterium]|nr:helix-turn-helix transcriptional regulator [Phycisphaerales bacterium]